MGLNEIKIRLSGTANLLTEPTLSREYDLTVSNAEIRESKDIPNDDGTINRIFKLVISERSEINLIAEKELIRSKDKKSQSQKLRAVIFEYWSQQNSGEIEFEEFYTRQMAKLIEAYKSKLQ